MSETIRISLPRCHCPFLRASFSFDSQFNLWFVLTASHIIWTEARGRTELWLYCLLSQWELPRANRNNDIKVGNIGSEIYCFWLFPDEPQTIFLSNFLLNSISFFSSNNCQNCLLCNLSRSSCVGLSDTLSRGEQNTNSLYRAVNWYFSRKAQTFRNRNPSIDLPFKPFATSRLSSMTFKHFEHFETGRRLVSTRCLSQDFAAFLPHSDRRQIESKSVRFMRKSVLASFKHSLK